MATIQVTNDTQADLVSAIARAGAGDVIVFSTAGTIILSASLTIGHGVTIDGGGAITLQGNASFTDVVVTGGAVTIKGLTIANGAGTGAAGADGTAGAVNGGQGGDAAGGIFNNGGALTVSGVTFLNDSATGGAGGAGLSFADTSGAGGGGGGGGGSAAGAIFNEAGSLVIANLVFINVTATGGAGGVGGTGGGAFTTEGVPTPSFGGTGGAGGLGGTNDLPPQDPETSGGASGVAGSGVGGSLGAFGGFGAAPPAVGFAWQASGSGTAGDPGTGNNGLGGGGGGGGAGGVGFSAIGGAGQLVPCFAAGTRIATGDGEIAVERLRAGDVVRLARGGTAAVRWVGHRALRVAGHPRPQDVMPVGVLAGAFGEGVPGRDLLLSPDHAVFVAGMLVPVRYLLNGATVASRTVERITYYHVELARHDVLLAEGLAAESFLDTGNRGAFVNGGGAVMAHPDFSRAVWQAQGCAPLATGGEVVRAVQAHLLARAAELGFAVTLDAAPELVADGVVVRAVSCIGHLWRFELPRPAGLLRLRSRRAVPSEMVPGHADGRRLGVAVSLLRVDGRTIDLASVGEGWHGVEGGLRWTDGDALLPVAAGRVVELNLLPLVSYWVAPEVSAASNVAVPAA